MKERRLLFHFHTYYSFDASITLRQLARVVKKHEITHVAITEHNNLKSYRPAREYFERMGIGCELIPGCEYTTDVGDIIVLFCDQQLVFDDYRDLLAQAKERDAVTCLPHPYKRAEYPEDLVNDIDLYEAGISAGPTRVSIGDPGGGRTTYSQQMHTISSIFRASSICIQVVGKRSM